MKRFLIGIITLFPLIVRAQPLKFTARVGYTGYRGDLQSKNFSLNPANEGLGVGLMYSSSSKLSIRVEYNYGVVEANDLWNDPQYQLRNLSFKSKIQELALLTDWSLLDPEDSYIVPYVFAGIAFFHFNPYTFDSTGTRYYLQPLSTEGQGLPGRAAPYKLNQVALPFGGGVRFEISSMFTIAYELGFRKTFTDYIDDVSTTYVDQNRLQSFKGLKAVDLAFRGDEVKAAPSTYPAEGTIRGSAGSKDWYYFHGLHLIISLNRTSSPSARSSTDCPRVYF